MKLFDNGELPKNVLICGATNRPGDKAGVSALCEPLRSRFNVALAIPTPGALRTKLTALSSWVPGKRRLRGGVTGQWITALRARLSAGTGPRRGLTCTPGSPTLHPRGPVRGLPVMGDGDQAVELWTEGPELCRLGGQSRERRCSWRSPNWLISFPARRKSGWTPCPPRFLTPS